MSTSVDRLKPVLIHQPQRPTHAKESGHILNYRTHPKEPSGRVRFCTYESIVCQIMLYRWVTSDQFVNMPPIRELKEFLFGRFPFISKRAMGMMVHQAVLYDPKRLKAKSKSVPDAINCYHFWEREDLEYGLEWMLTSWLLKMTTTISTEYLETMFARIKSASEEDLDKMLAIIDEKVQNGQITEWGWELEFKENHLHRNMGPNYYIKVEHKGLWQLMKAAQLRGLTKMDEADLKAMGAESAEAHLRSLLGESA